MNGMFLKFIRYMTANKIQVEFENGGYATIWPEVTAPERHEKIANVWFQLSKLSLSEWVSLKFTLYMTINKIQVEFEKGGYPFIWTGSHIWYPLNKLKVNDPILLKFKFYLTINRK